MISRLHIKNYKCLKNEDMEFRPLTVLTGTNSSGKSSVLQAVLLLARNCNPKNRERMYDLISEYQELACHASLMLDGTEYRYSSGSDSNSEADILRWEDSLYFLTANRAGPESLAKMSKEYKVGNNGEFLFGTFARYSYMEWNGIKFQDIKHIGINIKSLPVHYINIEEDGDIIKYIQTSIKKLREDIVSDIANDASKEKIENYKKQLDEMKEYIHSAYKNIQIAYDSIKKQMTRHKGKIFLTIKKYTLFY
ncbi:MAG: AAA family ATPase [Desulfovibrio piger]|uniref:AAA family ATPase n=1 Tax=Desulfovibrio piger TaxID=901 RepID=UPI00399A1359